MIVTFDGNSYTCDSALRGGDYVLLFSTDMPTVSFFGVVDFDAFQLSGGEWSYPYVTLDVDNWVGTEAPYTQEISYPGVTSTNDVLVSPMIEDAEGLAAVSRSQIMATEQGLGTLTFSAFGAKPEVDVKFNVKVLI